VRSFSFHYWLLSAAALALPGFSQAPASSAPVAAEPEAAGAQAPAEDARDLFVTVGKSLVIDSPVQIQRVSVADGTIAEALVVTPREVLVHGKVPGQTSLIIWQLGGNRLLFDLNVRANTQRLDAVRQELRREFEQGVNLSVEGPNVYLRGTVQDKFSAARADTIARTLGPVVNLLRVKVPAVEPQILLKVRFANVDRAAGTELGANIFSTGALNTPGAVTTGLFSPPKLDIAGRSAQFSLTDALNIFLFRPDLDLGTTIRALQSKRFLEILAEPNVLALNGKQASFLAGGEFPFPTLQGGASAGGVTIQFREFGVRINFLPTVTPLGTIRLQVTPEVSSLDFANGLVFQGFNVPALSTRRVQTEIELESGQSFGLAGLLDNRVTESWSKVPGIGDIPFFGKLFRSKSVNRNNTELLVLVTPEIVRPIPATAAVPDVKMPAPFLEGAATTAPRTPGIGQTGPVPVKASTETIPLEQLAEMEKLKQGPSSGSAPAIQMVPMMIPQPTAPTAPPPAAPASRPPANEGGGQAH